MSEAGGARELQARADAALEALVGQASAEEAALGLAWLLNRAATRLHNVARAEAATRKEQPTWPAWAQLQNASRGLVLQASTVRDLAARLAAPHEQTDG
jgi:hypothetical protein